jgi:hypothetical protein
LRDDARVRPEGAVRVELLEAVGLVVVLALAALEARVALSADADSLTLLDQGDLRSYANGLAHDLCPDISAIGLRAAQRNL